MGTGMFGLPMALFEETAKWTQGQWHRQAKYMELAFRVPEAPEWITPNEVALELTPLRLRDFSRVHDDQSLEYHTETFSDVPFLVITPQVNHSGICDYSEGQSLVRRIAEQGFRRVYATEWRSADAKRADESLDDIIQAIDDCVEHIGTPVRLLGLCQGGWMSAVYSALYPEKVAGLVMAAAPIDFHAEPSGVNMMARSYPMAMYNSLVAMGGGVMRGDFISMGFDNLRPMERYFGKYFSLWAHCDNEKFVERYKRLTNWYGTPQNIPGKAYLQIVKLLFKKNYLIKKKLKVHDRIVDLAEVTAPTYMIAGSRDHITRPSQLFAAADHVSSNIKRQYTTDAGHIGVFMSQHAIKHDWPTLLQDIHKDASELAAAA